MWLFRFSILLVCATLALLLAGGLVTSHEAGLAVPDWPLSYGQFFPPMVGNIFWEHGHRMIAGLVGLWMFAVALAVQLSGVKRLVKILAWIAFASVVAQALLGGLTVLYLLPAPISIAHACLAQTFFCLTIALAYFLNPEQKNFSLTLNRHPEGFRDLMIQRIRKFSVVVFVMFYAQLILGATVRHTNQGVIPHIVMAILLILTSLFFILRIGSFFEERTGLPKLGLAVGVLLLMQFFLGVGSFIYTQMLERSYAPSFQEVLFTAAHQTTGACLLGLSFFVTLKIFYEFR